MKIFDEFISMYIVYQIMFTKIIISIYYIADICSPVQVQTLVKSILWLFFQDTD